MKYALMLLPIVLLAPTTALHANDDCASLKLDGSKNGPPQMGNAREESMWPTQ